MDDSDDEDDGKRRADDAARRAAADRRVGRFPVTDLAIAIAFEGENRRRNLEKFNKGKPSTSYAVTRGMSRALYGARIPPEEALIPDLPPSPWGILEAGLRSSCRPNDVDSNLEVARLIFDHGRAAGVEATQHEPAVLRVAAGSVVPIGIDLYVTCGSRLVFEFLHLRRTPLTPRQAVILASLIHYAYCIGDFASAEVDIVSMCAPGDQRREIHVQTIAAERLLTREQLDPEIEDVYRILRDIAGA